MKTEYDWKARRWRIKTRQRLAKGDGLACWWCKNPLTLKAATIDHVKPKSQGGADVLKNLRLACHPCNTERNQRLK